MFTDQVCGKGTQFFEEGKGEVGLEAFFSLFYSSLLGTT